MGIRLTVRARAARRLPAAGLAAVLLIAAAAVGPQAAGAQAGPPPAGCSGRPTAALTEGPFYRAGSPERQSLLEPGVTGNRLVLSGTVFDARCRPVAGAWLDFWQADGAGRYDNQGWRLRGHQLTDASGRFRLETVLPGEYPGRTPHIHVKIRAPNGPTLTTQIFFPGEAGNSRDAIFDPGLVVRMTGGRAGQAAAATLDFVVDTGPSADG